MNEFRQLDDLVRSAAREPLPPIDWQRVERGLFDRIDREPIRLGSQRTPWAPVAAIAAAAAVIATFSALAASGGSRHDAVASPAGTVMVAPNHGLPPSGIQATDLHERDRIEAGPDALLVRHPGRAAWNLSPRSRVVIEKLGPSVQLSLEAGSVRVEVAPGSDHDAFVVRVDDTTVSVHGTVFSVQRLPDRASVQVEQGAVSVGSPSKRGTVSSWLMVAPSAGTFSLDGARVAAFSQAPAAGPPVDPSLRASEVFVPAPGPSVTEPDSPESPPARPIAVSPGRRQDRSTAAPEPSQSFDSLPEKLTAASARSLLDRLASGIADCHRRLRPPTHPGDPVRLTVHTTLSMTVAPEGHVSLGRFEPPLAPDVQACAANILLSTRFPQTRGSSQLRLPLSF